MSEPTLIIDRKTLFNPRRVAEDMVDQFHARDLVELSMHLRTELGNRYGYGRVSTFEDAIRNSNEDAASKRRSLHSHA